MTITISAYSGTHTVQTTEWSMTTDTSGPDVCTDVGIFQAYLDLTALDSGDVFQFTLYETVAPSGGTQRAVVQVLFSNAQTVPDGVTPAFTLGVGWDMTLKKISGTDRSIPWRITQVA
jgi:hypothetical protein